MLFYCNVAAVVVGLVMMIEISGYLSVRWYWLVQHHTSLFTCGRKDSTDCWWRKFTDRLPPVYSSSESVFLFQLYWMLVLFPSYNKFPQLSHFVSHISSRALNITPCVGWPGVGRWTLLNPIQSKWC